MATDPLLETGTARHRTAVSRRTVALFALLVTMADGYWATSLRGATGYIQNTQQPFRDWVLYLAVMLPIFAGTVLAALWLARRLVRHGAARLLVGAALVVVLTTALALAQMGLTAAYDYRSQVRQETLMHHIHNPNGATI